MAFYSAGSERANLGKYNDKTIWEDAEGKSEKITTGTSSFKRKKLTKKKKSFFISKDEQDKLRGLPTDETVGHHVSHHKVTNHHFQHVMQREKRALEKRNKKSRKNQKKLYANIKRDTIASASGRSLALSVVQQSAQIAMMADSHGKQHHKHHHNVNEEDEVNTEDVDNFPEENDNGLVYTEEHPLGLPTGMLMSTKTFLLAQDMKLTIRKTKERQIIISVTDNHFREYAIINTEPEILNVLDNESDRKRFCKLERKQKLQLIVSMVTFTVGKSRGKLKKLTLALPPKETLALFYATDDEEEGDGDEKKIGRKEGEDDKSKENADSDKVGIKKKLHAGKGWFKAKQALQKININKYRELIRSSPLDPKGYVKLGKLYLKYDKLKEGIDLFRSAVRIKHVNLQVKPFDGNFWKQFVNALNAYNEKLEYPKMETLIEANNAFQFSLRFFQNLTDPNHLCLGAKIQEKSGDVESSSQTLARIIQNFPSVKILPSIIFKAAACELHQGNFPQSQSYFEFLLIDPPSKFSKDDIILLVSLLLNLNKRSDSAFRGYKYLYDKLYDKGGLFTDGLYRKKTVKAWYKCSDLWIDFANKMLKNGEPLLANNLFKEGLFLGGYDDNNGNQHEIIGKTSEANLSAIFDSSLSSTSLGSLLDGGGSPTLLSPEREEEEEPAIHHHNINHFHNHNPIKEKATTWWKAAECAYSVKDFNFAAYCCNKTLFNDPDHTLAHRAKQKWEVPMSASTDFTEFKLGVDEELMMEAKLRTLYDRKDLRSPMSNTHNRNDNSLMFEHPAYPDHIEITKYNERKRRPVSEREAAVIERLHEGLSADKFENALSNRKLSRGKKFDHLLTRALTMKTSKLNTVEPSPIKRSNSNVFNKSNSFVRPQTAGSSRTRRNNRRSARPQTAGSSRRRNTNNNSNKNRFGSFKNNLMVLTMPEDDEDMLNRNSSRINRNTTLRATSPTTLLTMGRSLKKSAAKTDGQLILENLKKQDVWNLSNIRSTLKQVVTKRHREKVRSIKKKTKYNRTHKKEVILGSKLGLPIAYSKGAISGIIPPSVATRPPLCDTEARKTAHDFYDREIARKKAFLESLKRFENFED